MSSPFGPWDRGSSKMLSWLLKRMSHVTSAGLEPIQFSLLEQKREIFSSSIGRVRERSPAFQSTARKLPMVTGITMETSWLLPLTRFWPFQTIKETLHLNLSSTNRKLQMLDGIHSLNLIGMLWLASSTKTKYSCSPPKPKLTTFSNLQTKKMEKHNCLNGFQLIKSSLHSVQGDAMLLEWALMI